MPPLADAYLTHTVDTCPSCRLPWQHSAAYHTHEGSLSHTYCWYMPHLADYRGSTVPPTTPMKEAYLTHTVDTCPLLQTTVAAQCRLPHPWRKLISHILLIHAPSCTLPWQHSAAYHTHEGCLSHTYCWYMPPLAHYRGSTVPHTTPMKDAYLTHTVDTCPLLQTTVAAQCRLPHPWRMLISHILLIHAPSCRLPWQHSAAYHTREGCLSHTYCWYIAPLAYYRGSTVPPTTPMKHAYLTHTVDTCPLLQTTVAAQCRLPHPWRMLISHILLIHAPSCRLPWQHSAAYHTHEGCLSHAYFWYMPNLAHYRDSTVPPTTPMKDAYFTHTVDTCPILQTTVAAQCCLPHSWRMLISHILLIHAPSCRLPWQHSAAYHTHERCFSHTYCWYMPPLADYRGSTVPPTTPMKYAYLTHTADTCPILQTTVAAQCRLPLPWRMLISHILLIHAPSCRLPWQHSAAYHTHEGCLSHTYCWYMPPLADYRGSTVPPTTPMKDAYLTHTVDTCPSCRLPWQHSAAYHTHEGCLSHAYFWYMPHLAHYRDSTVPPTTPMKDAYFTHTVDTCPILQTTMAAQCCLPHSWRMLISHILLIHAPSCRLPWQHSAAYHTHEGCFSHTYCWYMPPLADYRGSTVPPTTPMKYAYLTHTADTCPILQTTVAAQCRLPHPWRMLISHILLIHAPSCRLPWQHSAAYHTHEGCLSHTYCWYMPHLADYRGSTVPPTTPMKDAYLTHTVDTCPILQTTVAAQCCLPHSWRMLISHILLIHAPSCRLPWQHSAAYHTHEGCLSHTYCWYMPPLADYRGSTVPPTTPMKDAYLTHAVDTCPLLQTTVVAQCRLPHPWRMLISHILLIHAPLADYRGSTVPPTTPMKDAYLTHTRYSDKRRPSIPQSPTLPPIQQNGTRGLHSGRGESNRGQRMVALVMLL